MNTFTYIIIWLFICALITLFIPAVKNQWRASFKSIAQDYRGVNSRLLLQSVSEDNKNLGLKEGITKFFLSILVVIFSLLLFILTPLIIPLLIKIDKKRIDEEKIEQERVKDEDANLYFWKMGGAGKIKCLDCSYQEEITSFTHGLNTSTTGLQCKDCGKFQSIQDWLESDKQARCECGGVLNRDEALFCPECNSQKLHYLKSYIT